MTLAGRYPLLVVDLDGTVLRGEDPIPGVGAALTRARAEGARVVYATNNATRTPDDVVVGLRRAGIDADPGEVVTSALATASALGSRGIRSALVVGEAALRGAIDGAGIHIVRSGDDVVPEVVVVGLDRGVTYADLRAASLAVRAGAPLVATNADGSFPVPDGLVPGAGALVSAIETATGARAEVIGKPAPTLFEVARMRAVPPRDPVLVVGDRLDTDIAAAVGLGWDSLLVLTGVSRREDLRGSSIRPTYVAEDLGGLVADPEPTATV